MNLRLLRVALAACLLVFASACDGENEYRAPYDGPDVCVAGLCESPPPSVCADEQTLLTHLAYGTCEDGRCKYDEQREACPAGCRDGACVEPRCCGCLCADGAWSCGEATCLSATGAAIGLERELGFLQLEDRAATSDSDAQLSTVLRTRMWYSFFPAETAPEDKPVLLLFNGGPGAPPLLMGLGTGATNLFGEHVEENPYRWTRFANLLYVDPKGVGFSYSVLDSTSSSPEEDARLHLRALLAFLKRHPSLRDNPIGIVGESYGGVRATFILHDALHYLQDGPATRDPSDLLGRELSEYFMATLGHVPETSEEAASQFAFQILIEPVVGAFVPGNCTDEQNNGDRDREQCDQPSDFTSQRIQRVYAHLVNPADWQDIWGDDLGHVAWMLPAARMRTTPHWCGSVAVDAMAVKLGPLTQEDCYYVPFDRAIIGDSDGWTHDGSIDAMFVEHIRSVKTLVTNAQQDGVVDMDALPSLIQKYGADVEAVRYDEQPRAGVVRPGWVDVVMREPDGTMRTHEFRMPRYAKAGHMVALSAPREFSEDVAALLSAVPGGP